MSDEDYYTIRGADLGDLPLRSRPRPLRVAALFALTALALTALVFPDAAERDERRLAGYGAPYLDDRAVGSIRPARDPLGLEPLRFDPLRTGPLRPTRGDGAEAGGEGARSGTYIVRRSVLQEGSVCIIGSGGYRSGNC